MSKRIRLLLHWLGGGLALLGVLFVALRLRDYGTRIDLSTFTWQQWLAIAALGLVYGAANLLLAFAWRLLLRRQGVKVSVSWALRVYGVSQLAKYVPGNVFQFAGRQAIGMAAGLPATALAKSTGWELVLLAVAGGAFAPWVLPLVWPELLAAFVLLFWACAVSLVWLAIARFLEPSASRAWLLQVLFLSVSATIFIALLELIESQRPMGFGALGSIMGAYILAWLVGLVTPGAPAGLGVRELVLLLLLNGVVVEADLLLAVMLGRLTTVLGDLAYFLAAFFSRNVLDVRSNG